jgi:hypothetical protein
VSESFHAHFLLPQKLCLLFELEKGIRETVNVHLLIQSVGVVKLTQQVGLFWCWLKIKKK